MHMLAWNTYREQLIDGVGGMAKLRATRNWDRRVPRTGHLDAKTRELIALAVAISLRCDSCITVHVAEARKLGATKEEIAEALGIAISINAGAGLVTPPAPWTRSTQPLKPEGHSS